MLGPLPNDSEKNKIEFLSHTKHKNSEEKKSICKKRNFSFISKYGTDSLMTHGRISYKAFLYIAQKA